MGDRVLDFQAGSPDARNPECLDGRGAAPPEHCGGPRGYRLMVKRQAVGSQISDPAPISASVKLLAHVYRDEADIAWQFFEEVVTTGWESVE
jgi:pRiA4b ORF-3-like protein